LSLFDIRDLAEIRAPACPGERLIACRNPLLADERARKRLRKPATRSSTTVAVALIFANTS
jgi:hypothetical protein